MKRVLATLIMIFAASTCLAQEPEKEKSARLYVFLPSYVRPYALQRLFARACPDLELTVFGRLPEFKKMVSNSPPDAILSLKPVTDSINGFSQTLTGERKGFNEEKYILLSIDRTIDIKNMEAITIGMVDLLGHREMESLLQEKLGYGKPRVKTVQKMEDLISLLRFNDADAICVPESSLSFYTGRTKMNLQVTEIPGLALGLATLAVRTERKTTNVENALKESFLNLTDDLNKRAGVESWVTPPEPEPGKKMEEMVQGAHSP